MRIAYITAGAAGMFCGSCMRDNTLVTALRAAGHDALLIPTYTPIRTDERDVSQQRIFYGGINVYLEQKFWLFRHTPRLFDRLLNFRFLLRWVSRFAANTKYSELGTLAISMLEGTEGKQAKELSELIDWLAREVRPESVVLTNALLSGIVPELMRVLGVPVHVTLQGDDIFLDELPEADRKRCVKQIRENCQSVSSFICTSRYYADYMAEYLGIDRQRMHVIYPGISLESARVRATNHVPEQLTIGYFARISPEKGFHNLIDAYIQLRQLPNSPQAKLLVGGWLGENQREYYNQQVKKLSVAGYGEDFEYRDCPTHDDKMTFFQSLDVFTVPTDYHEPKGLYILEAWANGVPVVQPKHGAFPELIEASQGGLLVPPGDPQALAHGLLQLLQNHDQRLQAGRHAESVVRERFSAPMMAAQIARLLQGETPPRNGDSGLTRS